MKITTVATDTGGSIGILSLDCNGDGIADLVALNRTGSLSVFIGNPDMTFRGPRTISLPQVTLPAGIATGDLNGDGWPDLVVASKSPAALYTLLGDGNCAFNVPTPLTGPLPFNQVAVADINVDGKADLVASDGTIKVYLGDGAGGFGPPLAPAVSSPAKWFAVADMNLDGKPDIVAVSPGLWIGLGDGSGLFGAPGAGTVPGRAPEGTLEMPAIGDVNGDGKPDFVIPSSYGTTDLYRSVPTPGVLDFQISTVGPSYGSPSSPLLVKRPTGDKKDQLVIPNKYGNSVVVYDLGAGQALDSHLLGYNRSSPFPNWQSGSISVPVAVVALASGGFAVAGSDGVSFLEPDCPMSFSPANGLFFVPNPSAPQVVQVNVAAGCSWNAAVAASAGYASVTPPAGIGPATVLVQMQPNGGAGRSAPITWSSGRNQAALTATQAKAGSLCPEPSVDRTTLTVGPAGGTVQVAVTLPETVEGCRTTAGSTNSAVTATPGEIVGAPTPITVSFTVPANPGDTRNFYAMVGPDLLTITSTGACPPSVGTFNGTLSASPSATVIIPVSVPLGCVLTPTGKGLSGILSMPDSGHLRFDSIIPPVGSPWTGTLNLGGRLAHLIQKIDNPTQVFSDVPLTHVYADWITLLKGWGVTNGCSPTMYCPEDPVTRGQMAVFVIRSVEQGDFFPFTATPYFGDVPPSHPYFKYIQRMKDLGITLGCGNGNYCANDPVTRGQMAVFLMRARMGIVGGVPLSYPGSPFFTDVPPSDPYYPFIQNLRAFGVTVGCSETSYCGSSPVTRGQMAVFLIRTFFTPW